MFPAQVDGHLVANTCSANLAGKYLETTLDRLPHFSQVKVNYVEAKLNEQILNQNPAYVINPGLMTEKS